MNQKIEEENILLHFKENSYTAMTCFIESTYIYADPPFQEYKKYLDVNDSTYGDFDETTYNNQKDYYEGKIIQYYINIEENLTADCGNNCELCLGRDKNYCITCNVFSKYEYDESINNEVKVCENFYPEITIIETEETTEKTTEQSTEEETTGQATEQATESKTEPNIEEIERNSETEIITDKVTESNTKTCTNEEILNDQCNDGSMSNDQVGQVFNYFKETVLTKDYKGENTIVETENVILQISTLEDQKNSNNPNVSTIDLGDCEKTLKSKYNIYLKKIH